MRIESWLSLTAIFVALVGIFISAMLAYHISKKTFRFQIKKERLNRLMLAVGILVTDSEQLGSLIKTEGEKMGVSFSNNKNEHSQMLFDKNAKKIYSRVSKWSICKDFREHLKNAINCGITEELKKNDGSYDKFISLYHQLRADHIDDTNKIKISHIILFSKGLYDDLKSIHKRLADEISRGE